MTVTGLEPFILVVDDTPANLEVMSEALTDAGYEVAIAISGERAIKQIQHSRPSLILLDVQMPGIDGFETCRQLKENPDTASIPVIFMTALSDAESKVRGFGLGAVDYITKPFQEKEVLARVSTHLRLQAFNQELEQRVAERTTELTQALEQLQQSQLQLVQHEKMSALGGLVAGVAHEINNPVGFISGNLKPALEYIQDLFGLIELYQKKFPDPGADIKAEIEAIDLDYIREDLPKLVASMREGTNRIRSISHSLRTFSRADNNQWVKFDLHEGLDSTLMILKHRLKANESRPDIEVTRDYADLPLVECCPGQMNQVFMNILANAIDALEDGNRDRSFADIQANPNRISVQTAVINNGSQVAIHIADNGTGMTEAVRQHIFDHFTTKPVGQGTGLGLSIVQQIVVEHHGGQLQVNSAPGEGAEFVIHLPIQGRHAAERQPADELLADRLKANEAEAVPVLTRDEAAEAARPDEMRSDEMRSDEMRPDEMRSHQPVSPSL